MGMINNVKVSPIKGKTSIGYSSDFGWRTLNGKKSYHNGIDLPGQKNSCEEIIAVARGKVVAVRNTIKGYSRTYLSGNYVTIDHGNGVKTVYCHMLYGSVKVKKGDIVEKGQVIGAKGNTGYSFGAHLHFGVNVNGKYVDPKPYLLGTKEFVVSKNPYEEFVKGVQSACGAKVDGIAGPETLSKTITISKTQNRKHPVVKVVQTYLDSLGYDLGKYGIDGCFGNDMEKVIMKFQKDNGLEHIDGIITAKMYTWKKLLKIG